MLHSLQERAKELECLYRVETLLRQSETTPEILAMLPDALPPGWQYPELTRVRVTHRGSQYLSSDFKETEWSLSAPIDAQKP